MKSMYLDDIRNPKMTNKDWAVVRSSAEAIDYVTTHGMTDYASFDHDLGGDDTTMVFLRWLIDYDMDNGGSIISPDFTWNVHSSNPVGEVNIDGLLNSYMNTKKLFDV